MINNNTRGKFSYGRIFWLFLLGGVVGVALEGLFCLAVNGKWESHVVSVFGVYNIIYGFGAVAFYLCADRLERYGAPIKALAMAGAATALELVCGLILKYGLGMRAWSYENSFLNLGGLICPAFSVLWWVAGLGFCALYPWLCKLLDVLCGKCGRIACAVFSVFVALDLSVTTAFILRWSARHRNIEAETALERRIDTKAPDEWMERRFVDWHFLD